MKNVEFEFVAKTTKPGGKIIKRRVDADDGVAASENLESVLFLAVSWLLQDSQLPPRYRPD